MLYAPASPDSPCLVAVAAPRRVGGLCSESVGSETHSRAPKTASAEIGQQRSFEQKTRTKRNPSAEGFGASGKANYLGTTTSR